MYQLNLLTWFVIVNFMLSHFWTVSLRVVPFWTVNFGVVQFLESYFSLKVLYIQDHPVLIGKYIIILCIAIIIIVYSHVNVYISHLSLFKTSKTRLLSRP